jgi:hypothetical protein
MRSRNAMTHDGFRTAGPRLRDRFRARREGWKDGRRSLPEPPVTLTDEGLVRLARPGYRQELQARVDVVSEKYAAEAQRRHHRLVEELMARATDVVYHAEAGTLERVHRSRLQSALGRWANAIQPQRSVVAAAVAEAEQLLQCYWAVIGRRHRRLRAIRSGRAEGPIMTNARGGRIRFDPAAWKPEPILLDHRWERPEEFLLRQPDIRPDDESAHRFGPLARALEILRYMPPPEPAPGG